MNSRQEPALLNSLLRNEADIAARHRVRAILDYLDIQPGERVLECGCGLGFILEILSQLYDIQLTGLDYSTARLNRAQSELHKRVPLAAGDILRLPYPDQTFDKIVLSEVLEHLPDDLGGLREVQRVLKPGGVVAITVPHHRYPLLWDPINWTRERLGLAPIRSGFFGGLWTDHVRLYTQSELVELVQNAGLTTQSPRQFVHYCFPFSHNLVYGLGKWLVESGRLRSADRFYYHENSGSLLNPINWGLRLFNWIDRLNDPISEANKTTVILSIKAVKL